MSLRSAPAWAQRANETAPAWEAFSAYLELGPCRSVRAVAKGLDKSKTLVGRWSSRHDWPERAAAYDAHVLQLAAQEVAEARASLAQRHVAVARTALEKVATAIEVVDPEELTARDAARLWELAVKTEREAHGLAGSLVAAEVDLRPLLPEAERLAPELELIRSSVGALLAGTSRTRP